MTTWFRSHRVDGDVRYFFEVDDEGFVRRQVELEGTSGATNAASSSEEVEAAYRDNTIGEYFATYGLPEEWSTQAWDHELEPFTEEEFEVVWVTAREACAAGSRSRPTPG
jgi:hypothetical protein